MSGFDKIQAREEGLHKKLTGRQMSMIAIGGAIGTGLFLGSKLAIGLAGPGILISYGIAGVIALLLMGCLAEMTVAHPTSGSFGAYAEHYLSPLAGYLVRYCYWSSIVLGVGTEVTAIARYMEFWFPHINGIVWVLSASVVLIGANAYSVKTFGSLEYWFSFTKIAAIIGFILLGCGVLFSQFDTATVSANITGNGDGFMPKGMWGVWSATILAVFSYFSLEMIAVAAGEAIQPKTAIRQAFRLTIVRLLIFYFLSLSLIIMLVPWQSLIAAGTSSPFVTVMQSVGIPYADSVLNAVVIIAALSAMNSMLYVSTRMIFSLARAGQAPSFLGRVREKNGVPMYALALSAVGIAVAAIVYSINPQKAFPIMISLATFGALVAWFSIFVSHLFFRLRVTREGRELEFKMPGFPYGTLLGAGLLLAIIISTWFVGLFHKTLLFGLPFLALLLVTYWLRNGRPAAKKKAADSKKTLVDAG